MSWRLEIRPEVEGDVAKAAEWYNRREADLGAKFVEEVIRIWDQLEGNPLLNSRRHPRKNMRWRFPERFPYKIVYEVDEERRVVIVAAVLHAARADGHWMGRVE